MTKRLKAVSTAKQKHRPSNARATIESADHVPPKPRTSRCQHLLRLSIARAFVLARSWVAVAGTSGSAAQDPSSEEKAIRPAAKRLCLPASESMRRGDTAHESAEADDEPSASADAANGTAERAIASIDGALALIKPSNLGIAGSRVPVSHPILSLPAVRDTVRFPLRCHNTRLD